MADIRTNLPIPKVNDVVNHLPVAANNVRNLFARDTGNGKKSEEVEED